MAFDEGLAERIRELVGDAAVTEKKMFGGLSFLVGGNLACGIIKNELIVRVDPARHAGALKKKHTRPFDFTGRPMQGWVVSEPAGFESDRALASWVRQASRSPRACHPSAERFLVVTSLRRCPAPCPAPAATPGPASPSPSGAGRAGSREAAARAGARRHPASSG